MKPRFLFLLLCAGYFGCAQAEIYKYIDADGHVTYSSTPMKGAKKLDLPPLSTSVPPSRGRSEGGGEGRSERRGETGSPSDFPRVDSGTQKNRDSARRKILEDELAAEEKLLAEARDKLKTAEDTPMVYRGKDGKTYRNVAQFEENVKSARDEVTQHENNIAALKSELANLK